MLHPKSLGLAGGILWGLSLFVMTLITLWNGYGADFVGMWMKLYPWMDLSVRGAFLGLAWGFADGFVGLYILAWLYNRFSAKA